MFDSKELFKGVRDKARHLSELVSAVRNHKYEVTPDGRAFIPSMGVFAGYWFRRRLIAPDGTPLGESVFHNTMTTEGMVYLFGAGLLGVTQITGWYVVPFSGNVTPGVTLTAATMPATLTEFTGYSEATRQAYTVVAGSGAQVNNTAALARITANTTGNVYGFAVVGGTGADAKSATTGTCLAAARDPFAPIALATGYKIDVEYIHTLANA